MAITAQRQNNIPLGSVQSIIKNWKEYVTFLNLPKARKESSERGINGTLKELEASEAEMDRLVSPRFFTSHSFMTGRQRESHTHDVHAGKLKAKWKKVL